MLLWPHKFEIYGGRIYWKSVTKAEKLEFDLLLSLAFFFFPFYNCMVHQVTTEFTTQELLLARLLCLALFLWLFSLGSLYLSWDLLRFA